MTASIDASAADPNPFFHPSNTDHAPPDHTHREPRIFNHQVALSCSPACCSTRERPHHRDDIFNRRSLPDERLPERCQMKISYFTPIVSCMAAISFISTAHAQFRGLDDLNRFGEKRTLCRQALRSSGIEDDMDQRIRDLVRKSYDAVDRKRGPAGSADASTHRERVEDSVNDLRDPVLKQLTDSCARNFTVSELRSVNDFYMSSAGQAWLRKGRTTILPEMDRAISGIQPRINEN
ncbi:DUF2059 domain-containing protein [Burkholderia sp. Bp9142]|uniref:DUF2059 domain-containing protein n=1 Tax=Burkholderia sp. Bp9142 TaxID=2184573 RepID=UPI000F5984E6|nr:DUF2059 domain-containing protein [Burkholderia sp. Bp9142]RQR37285.1 DUF2059 domain-containing protein [Burkholderia sp. Bp9142]